MQKETKLILSILFAVLAMLFIGAAAAFIISRRKKRNGYAPIEYNSILHYLHDVEITHLIGSGQFGDVYKGVWMYVKI